MNGEGNSKHRCANIPFKSVCHNNTSVGNNAFTVTLYKKRLKSLNSNYVLRNRNRLPFVQAEHIMDENKRIQLINTRVSSH